MGYNLNNSKVHFDKWLDYISPWNSSMVQRERVVWVSLEEVPLQVWHEKLFMSLGNSLGNFFQDG